MTKVKVVIETIVAVNAEGLSPQEIEEQAILQVQEHPGKYIERGYVSVKVSR